MSGAETGASTDADILDAARRRSDDTLTLLRELVETESPSGDEERIRAVADILEKACRERGGRVEHVESPGAGVHLLARFGEADPDRPPLLVLGHMDTVHPVGTLAEMPFRVDDDGRLGGPGVYDMKGGLACVLEGLSLLRERGETPVDEVVLLVSCDEEVGSTTSRALIEETARGARAALIPEPCGPGGEAKTRRKGVAGYRIEVEGVAVHAGIEPEKGASAVHEIAHQILAASSLSDAETGTTVNVGVIEGGTRTNVVAAHAAADVDVRFWTREEADRVHADLTALQARDGRCTVTVAGRVNRYPLERTPASGRLYDAARRAAAAVGFELDETGTGGASDGNLTSAVGCPTLDGLGPEGGGAHSADEHVRVDDLPRRVALMAALLRAL